MTDQLHLLLQDIARAASHVNTLREAVALVVAIILGALVSRLINRGLSRRSAGSPRLGIDTMRRLMFPAATLLAVLLAKSVLRIWQPTPVLAAAATLLLAMALIRLTIFMLRQTFAPGGWLQTSERWITWTIWLAVAAQLTGLWPHISRTLGELDFTLGSHRVSVLLILQGVIAVTATLLIALWLGRLAESRLMRASSLQINVRVMFAKLIQAGLLLAAILFTLPAIGVDLTVLSVFGGMLGVGIGFGLQKIAANYISGFIILMDRSVSLGDLVTIDNQTGTLSKMTARYVVVRDLTGRESIIPNESIITSTVVNHSFSDRKVRVALPIQVAYTTDLDVARKIMIEAAGMQSRVLQDPAPSVLILAFADSGINLELGIWVNDAENGTGALKSDIYDSIWKEFQRLGVEIPFPQREVRLLGAGNPGP